MLHHAHQSIAIPNNVQKGTQKHDVGPQWRVNSDKNVNHPVPNYRKINTQQAQQHGKRLPVFIKTRQMKWPNKPKSQLRPLENMSTTEHKNTSLDMTRLVNTDKER